MSNERRNSRIDLVALGPHLASRDVHKVVANAMRHGVRAVCVAPVWTGRVATMVRGSGLRVCSAVAFPHGTSKSTVKAIEATSTIKDGADEIEVVAHLAPLVAGDLDASRSELMEIVRAARSTRRDVGIHVTIESAVLAGMGKAALELACRAVRESGCDGIVTSSGFHPAGDATAEAVRSLKSFAHDLTIKAAGAIESEALARSLLDAGADRIAVADAAAIGMV